MRLESNNWCKMHGLPMLRYKAREEALYGYPGRKLHKRQEKRRRRNAKRWAVIIHRLALPNYKDRGMLNPNEVRQYLGMEASI